jgi:hypothetical protein
MLALRLLLNTVGIGLFCWLIFTLAVYALPFFVAINAGIWGYHGGAGVLGTPLVAVAASGMTLAIAQIAFAMTRSMILRAVIAAVFALPATFAGHHVVVLAMAQIGVPSQAWQEVFACAGAVFIGVTAWTRLTVFTEPQPVEPGGRSAAALNQFSRPPRARDDLFTLVVEQIFQGQRAGVQALERRSAIVCLSMDALDVSPVPYGRGRAFLSEVPLGGDAAISRILFLSLRPTVPTSCTALPRLATFLPRLHFSTRRTGPL